LSLQKTPISLFDQSPSSCGGFNEDFQKEPKSLKGKLHIIYRVTDYARLLDSCEREKGQGKKINLAVELQTLSIVGTLNDTLLTSM